MRSSKKVLTSLMLAGAVVAPFANGAKAEVTGLVPIYHHEEGDGSTEICFDEAVYANFRDRFGAHDGMIAFPMIGESERPEIFSGLCFLYRDEEITDEKSETPQLVRKYYSWVENEQGWYVIDQNDIMESLPKTDDGRGFIAIDLPRDTTPGYEHYWHIDMINKEGVAALVSRENIWALSDQGDFGKAIEAQFGMTEKTYDEAVQNRLAAIKQEEAARYDAKQQSAASQSQNSQSYSDSGSVSSSWDSQSTDNSYSNDEKPSGFASQTEALKHWNDNNPLDNGYTSTRALSDSSCVDVRKQDGAVYWNNCPVAWDSTLEEISRAKAAETQPRWLSEDELRSKGFIY